MHCTADWISSISMDKEAHTTYKHATKCGTVHCKQQHDVAFTWHQLTCMQHAQQHRV
jgi:hypothetical protein